MYAPCKTDGTCCDISQTSKLSAFALSFFLCLFRNVISKLNPYSFINPTHLPLTYPPTGRMHKNMLQFNIDIYTEVSCDAQYQKGQG